MCWNSVKATHSARMVFYSSNPKYKTNSSCFRQFEKTILKINGLKMYLKLKYERYIVLPIMWSCKKYPRSSNTFWYHRYIVYQFVCTENNLHKLRLHCMRYNRHQWCYIKWKNKNTNPNPKCNNGRTRYHWHTYALLFTFLAG